MSFATARIFAGAAALSTLGGVAILLWSGDWRVAVAYLGVGGFAGALARAEATRVRHVRARRRRVRQRIRKQARGDRLLVRQMAHVEAFMRIGEEQ